MNEYVTIPVEKLFLGVLYNCLNCDLTAMVTYSFPKYTTRQYFSKDFSKGSGNVLVLSIVLILRSKAL